MKLRGCGQIISIKIILSASDADFQDFISNDFICGVGRNYFDADEIINFNLKLISKLNGTIFRNIDRQKPRPAPIESSQQDESNDTKFSFRRQVLRTLRLI